MHPMLAMLSAEAVTSERAHRARGRRPSLAPTTTGSPVPAPAAHGAAPLGRRRRGLLWQLGVRSTRTG
jgi:hypothetical protein